jgi:hypothetical protein
MAPTDPSNEVGGGAGVMPGDEVFEKMITECLSFAEDDKLLQVRLSSLGERLYVGWVKRVAWR